MNDNTFDLLSLKDEINICKENLSYLLEISKQNEKLLNDTNEFHSLQVELNSIKQEINSIKEINNKTIDYLLLEIESHFDKQKQLNAGFNQMFDLNNANKSDIEEHEIIIYLKDKEIEQLNQKLAKLSLELKNKTDLIHQISNNQDSEDFMDTVQFLNNQLNILNNELDEKNDTISLLKEEISILNSIITEKDETINSVRSLKND